MYTLCAQFNLQRPNGIVSALVREIRESRRREFSNWINLCADKNEENIELLRLEKSNIKLAEYLTQLPDMKVLESKLHEAIERAKNRLAAGVMTL